MTPLLRTLAGIAVGTALGFLVYRFVGCKTGTCPITANPWSSMVVGGLLGALWGSGQ